MSKFYQYINEGYGTSRVEPIAESDAKDTIRYNCKKSVQNTNIWRGTRSFNQNFGFGNSEKFEELRKSANTANYYTLILDNSKEWSSFPQRSKSFVCATTVQQTFSYGSPYKVIPFDGTPIGVCPEADIWDSFRTIGQLSILNDTISLAASMLDLDMKKMQNNYKYLLKSLDEIGKDFKEKDPYPNWLEMQSYLKKTFFKKFDESNMKLSDFLLEEFKPGKNKFKLKKAGNKLPSDVEVWFQGKAIFIENGKAYKIVKEYGSVWEWANNLENGEEGVIVT